jgi:hypothetical protein
VNDTEDRRRFFRINDEVNLFYKVVDEQTMIAASEVTDDLLSSPSLVTAMDVLDQEARLVLLRIEKKEPEIAEYQRILDSKINLLTQDLTRYDKDISESVSRNANISATGLAFESDDSIEVGEILEIKLLLSSCFAVIAIFGRVVYCKKNEGSEDSMPFQIGLDYVNLKDQDREVLIKHVVKRQMQQIREQKGVEVM